MSVWVAFKTLLFEPLLIAVQKWLTKKLESSPSEAASATIGGNVGGSIFYGCTVYVYGADTSQLRPPVLADKGSVGELTARKELPATSNEQMPKLTGASTVSGE